MAIDKVVAIATAAAVVATATTTTTIAVLSPAKVLLCKQLKLQIQSAVY